MPSGISLDLSRKVRRILLNEQPRIVVGICLKM